jgi:hypothetical protein
MRKVLLAVFVGSTALATGALAQSANQTGSQAGTQTASIADCDRVIVFLEQRRVANPPITIEQARVFKRDANAQACRDALNRIEQASAQQPGAQGQQQQAGQQNQADPARIVVQQAQPNVTVQQGQPEIFVRQPQPTITVDIPQPEIVVRMPRPDVNVAMAQPQVQVQQNTGQPNVQVQQQAQPNVRYERAEPRVVVNQPQGQPTVRFEQPGEGRQAGADQNQQRQGTANQQTAANQQPGNQPATTGAVNPAGNMLTVGRLADMDLYGAQGEQLGEIEHVYQGRDGKQYIVIGRGGFLGLGERHVGVPAERVVWRGGRLVVQGMTNDQLKALPTFNRQDQSFRELEDNQQVQVSTAG